MDTANPASARTTIHLRPIRSPSLPRSGVATVRARAGAAMATPAQVWVSAVPVVPIRSR
ncbi:hypothetical protein SAMN05421805_101737 [Saccharopolyspora antimicrobica]|uniref:Uncharacterized protein n=1 Tax=Saccharopolyspora antimicrobica TaxID=455193 RepID=A0A1I4RXG1_9PSEU|nr:hypothetical protein [Saccharopolyspora antimicrobica]RKT89182.1 hypothetical protein ATL45_7634 [Saccharopolyspora antimicrobica]SFM56881.1 hypothetical protein SAMN05421805_101737 [Saccharopolyspora antimicrobica]